MNYYQVDVSSEPKIIGVTNGVHQIEIEKKEMQKKDEFNEFLTFFNTQNKGFWNNQDKIKDIKVIKPEGEKLYNAIKEIAYFINKKKESKLGQRLQQLGQAGKAFAGVT